MSLNNLYLPCKSIFYFLWEKNVLQYNMLIVGYMILREGRREI